MDVVTLGETMVLFIPTAIEPLRHSALFERKIGGAESDVAIGLSRLGHHCGWISRLGNDEFGLYIRNYIRGEGVDISRVIFDNEHATAVFFKERQAMQEPKIYYYRQGSAASYMTPQDLDEAYIATAKFLHITGITPALSSSCRETVLQAIAIARRNGVKVVFDPNIRLKLWTAETAKEVLFPLASQCDIVMPGLDEGQILTGKTEPQAIAQRLLENGAQAVVVKLGAQGAYFATPTEDGFVAAAKVTHIVDPLGAGDAFVAGFLSGLLRGWTYRAAVGLGNRVAAFALTVVGDVEGLPSWSQVNPQEKAADILR
ncbi:MAG: sugar kinase [Peptococcaceae bacterium]|nr:sugar kinase [Peptococcaceae bacterium]